MSGLSIVQLSFVVPAISFYKFSKKQAFGQSGCANKAESDSPRSITLDKTGTLTRSELKVTAVRPHARL
jgi:hypothetical protein